MKRSAFWLVVPVVFCASARPDLSDAKKAPGIDWQALVLRATGSGAPDVNALNPAQARLGAEKAAKTDALRGLLTQVRGVQITASKSIGDAMTNEEIRGKVEALLRGYRVTAKRYYSDMGIELDVEVPLAPLANMFAGLPEAGESPKPSRDRNVTGLVVDARGLMVVPALVPRLVDDSGKVLYGIETLAEDARKTKGVASYMHGLQQAVKDLRVAGKPLVVKASGVQGSDLVLSSAERKKLGDRPSFLSDGRVIIVFD